MLMTPRERAIEALNCRVPDAVPTFELEFQLVPEMRSGRDWLFSGDLDRMGLKGRERDAKLRENAELMVSVYRELEYSIMHVCSFNEEDLAKTVRYIREISGNEFLLTCHGDGTFAIPDGDGMYELSYRMVEEPESVHEQARRMADEAIARNRRMFDMGIESFILCSDYCFNAGPFMSPKMFSEFITPYLFDIIDHIRRMGGYAIKHTDGNIMPILDQMMDCRPHCIHSLDPMAGVDIAEVKRLTYPRGIAICGNVNCALLQTGTDDEVRQSALYALNSGKPGGGYIYSTSNCPFRGLDLNRYLMILDIWRQNRYYHEEDMLYRG
ncbi:MAG: hypothetical protein IJJ23_06860 [Clostridia bacterium]|nr:hypothetical protein [Clostridia bacterium]